MAATAFSLLPSPLPSYPPFTSSYFLSGAGAGISFRSRNVNFLSLRLPRMSSSTFQLGSRKRLMAVRAAADYYSTLGISRTASSKDINAAYRKLARQYYPDDKDPGATDKFKEISAAYEVLSDEKKRALFDQYGEAGIKSSVGGAGAYTTDPFGVFETFFGTPMGGGFPGMDAGFRTGRRATVTKGEDIRYDMALEFSEAIFGTYKEFELSHLETCEVCAGTGEKVGSRMRICSTCGGWGQVMRTKQSPFGLFSQVSVCSTCGGNGEVISENCRNCSGEGRVRVKKEIKVKVPAGVSKGSILRMVGEGDAGPKGGTPGDLYVHLDVSEIPEIQRDGINLQSTISISYTDAILGAVVQVKTVEGNTNLKIPPGTQTVEGTPGDLYVHLDVSEIPEIQRDGINLQSTISISYTDAILGAVVQVKTVEGNTNLKIPPGTQPEDVLVLTKKGAPKLSRPSIRGDHLFTVDVTRPKRISGDTDESQEPGDEDNLWKKLKDVAGSVAYGALKWLRDNL